MKKVTKLLLVASVAALGAIGFNACGDSITVVEPPPPQPPPEPPPVNAEITLQGFRHLEGGFIDPTDVSDAIIIIFNVTSGDFNIAQIDVLVDNVPIGCQTVSGSVGDLETANASDAVECFLDTAAIEGECLGEQLAPLYADGAHIVGGRLTTTEGTSTDAANAQTLTFNNDNYVALLWDLGTGVVNAAKDVTYYGGQDLDFWACPVVFDGDLTIGSVTFEATTGTLAPGAGAAVFGEDGDNPIDSDAPFIVTILQDENDGDVEDSADDCSPPGACDEQHTIAIIQLEDENGIDVTPAFDLTHWHGPLDFTGPTILAAPEITIDGVSSTVDYWSDGDFDLDDVVDYGVDYAFGPHAVINVGDCAELDNNDADPDTDFVTVVEDAFGIEDHPEDDPVADADTNELDCYLAELAVLTDFLENVTDLSTVDPTIQTATSYGVDRTAPELSDQAPDANGFILNDTDIQFDAEDPDLASGDDGSGVDDASIVAEDEDENPLVVDIAGSPTFEVDISGLADGAHTVTATIPDNAVLDPNETEHEVSFTLDTTDPTVNILNPPAANVTSSNATITFTFQGNASDTNDLSALTLTITTPGGDLLCGTGDDVDFAEGDDPGEVDDQEVAVDVSAGGEIDYSHNFVFQNTGDASDQTICFNATADDNGVDRDGDANPNSTTQSTQTDVNWQ